MAVNPVPYIIIGYPGGTRYPCDSESLATSPVVVDGPTISWGREEYLSHSEPAVLKFSLIDRTGQMAQQVTQNLLIGKQVQMLVELPSDTAWIRRLFWGRITGAKARPDVPDPYSTDPKAVCWLVEITASDKTADMAQAIMAPGTVWPQETALARANRLRNILNAANVAAGQMYFYPNHQNSVMSAQDVSDRDGLSLTKDFYMSMGDTYSYLPHENNVRYVHRRNYRVSARLVRDPDGVIRMRAADYVFDGQTYRGVGIEGCETTVADEWTEVSTQSAISRVEMTWKVTTSPGAPEHVTVVVADELPESERGRRTLTVTSWLGDGRQVDPVCLELLNRGRFEGSLPRHPRVIIDTRVSGGFHSRAECESLLMGGETQGVVYVSGSRYVYWSWLAPFYGLIGGQIKYADGRWLIECQLQPFGPGGTFGNPPARTWNQLNTSIRWTAPPTYGSLSDSFTWYDAAFLTDGNVYASTD